MIEKQSNQPSLGRALMAAGVVAVFLAFIGGCAYGYWLAQGPIHTPFGIRPNSETNLVELLPMGFVTALIALPAILALILGAGLPLFRLWLRRGYSSAAAYIGGGVIVAAIGNLIMASAHVFAAFLLGSDFVFSMLLIGISGPIAGFVIWCVLRRSSS
jgi:hypothetical protein